MQLRPMTMDDADKMLEWKNYKETRKFAIISHEIIKKENHLKWLPDNLKYFKIIEVADETAGAIRIKDNDISIWIDKDFWNKGVATSVLKKVSKSGMTAKIINTNVASMRAFIKAGFKPISYSPAILDGYYIFKK